MILELLLGPLCRDPTFYHDYCDKWDLCKVLDPAAQVPIKEDEDDEEGISEDYHMVVREPTLPLSYPYNSMLLPPLSPSPPPTSITFYLNVWGGNLPGQPDPASNITQFMPFRELLHLCYGFLDDTGELPIGSTVQHIPNDKVIRVLGISKLLVPHLTSNASYFISLLVMGSFQENGDEFTQQILSYGLLFLTFYCFPYTAGPPTSTAPMQPSPTFMRTFAQLLPAIPYTHRTIGPVPRRRPLI